MPNEEKRPYVLRIGAKLDGYCNGAFGREYMNTYRNPEFLLPHAVDPSETEDDE